MAPKEENTRRCCGGGTDELMHVVMPFLGGYKYICRINVVRSI